MKLWNILEYFCSIFMGIFREYDARLPGALEYADFRFSLNEKALKHLSEP